MPKFSPRAFIASYASILILAVLNILFILGCGDDQQNSTSSSTPKSQGPSKEGQICLYFTCGPEGMINTLPCNAPGGYGLLPIARGLEKKKQAGEDFLFFITSNLFTKATQKDDTYSELVAEHSIDLIPKIMRTMNIAAILPGIDDLKIGIDRYKSLTDQCQKSLVCANFVRKDNGNPVFRPYIIEELGGIKIGITGLFNQKVLTAQENKELPGGKTKRKDIKPVLLTSLLKEKDFEVLDPIPTGFSVAEELRAKGADFVVALTSIGIKKVETILNSSAVDLVIGTDLLKKDNYRVFPGGVRAVTGRYAESLGEISFYFSGNPSDPLGDRGELEKLRSEYAQIKTEREGLAAKYGTQDPMELDTLASGTEDGNRYRKCLKKEKRIASDMDKIAQECNGSHFLCRYLPAGGYVYKENGTQGSLWNEYLASLKKLASSESDAIRQTVMEKVELSKSIVDPASCDSCHPKQYAHWNSTTHAQAFQPVLRLDCEAHPRCFRCHSTGYLCTNGFTSPPPPEELGAILCEACHGFLGNHVDDFIQNTEAGIRKNPQDIRKLCTSCHDKQHSPNFEFKAAYNSIKCPKIDFTDPELQKLYLQRDWEFQRILSERGRLKSVDQYLEAALYKKRLDSDNLALIDILSQGIKIDPYSSNLVNALYPLLLEEEKPKDALVVMEEYLTKNPQDKRINFEIIRLLARHPDSEVHDPESAKSYIEWYIENLENDNIKIYIFQAQVELELGKIREAEKALNRAEAFNPSSMQMERINMLRSEIEKLRK